MLSLFGQTWAWSASLNPLNPVSCSLKMEGKKTSASDQEVVYHSGIKGGVPHSAAANQHQEEICWSYSLAKGLVEGSLKAEGRSVDLAPSYNLFYHYYSQFKSHLGYFRQMLRELNQTNPTERVLKTQQALKEAYKMITRKDYSDTPLPYTPYLPYAPNSAKAALDETKLAGLVPTVAYPQPPFFHDSDTEKLESAIATFTRDFMMNDKNLDAYKGVDETGINQALWSALSKKLEPALQVKTLKPTDYFLYKNKYYTPLTFMDELNFKPTDYVALVASHSTHEMAINAVVDQLNTTKKPVMIGISMFIEDVPAPEKAILDLNIYQNGTQVGVTKPADQAIDAAEMARNNGIFSLNVFPDLKKIKVDGAHEMTIVNYLTDENGKVIALVAKNSWGKLGARTVDGLIPSKPSEGGYYVIETSYLKRSTDLDINDSWDFVLDKTTAAKYPKLKIEEQ